MTTYESLLSGMWAPEGSEINDRLRRLQELEQMRKEREAKRQELLRSRGERTSGVITRAPRLRSQDIDSEAITEGGGDSVVSGSDFGLSRIRVRRTMSMKDDEVEKKENYGGARPKVSGYNSGGETAETSDGNWNLFSDITSSLVGPRPGMKKEREYGTSSLSSKRPYTSTKSYSRSTSQPAEEESIFADIKRSLLQPKTALSFKPKTFRSTYLEESEETPTYGQGYGYEDPTSYDQDGRYLGNQENGSYGPESNETHEHQTELHDEDEGEDPIHFIQRLKNRNHDNSSPYSFQGNNSTEYKITTIPAVPPYNGHNGHSEVHSDMPELVQPQEDILSVAQSINETFGSARTSTPREKSAAKTPRKSAWDRKRKTSSPRTRSAASTSKTETHEVNNQSDDVAADPNESVTYEIVEIEGTGGDSDAEDAGKMLPIRESIYHAANTEWDLNISPNKVDKMHEFFTGQRVVDDPNISRELDGRTVKAVLDESYRETKTPAKRAPATPAKQETPVVPPKSSKKNRAKTPPPTRKTPPKTSKVKNGKEGRSSGSENDSHHNSENENDRGGKSSRSPGRKGSAGESGLSIGDKLAKLESLTQEKSRRQSVGENEVKKVVPSYMAGTRTSQNKHVRVMSKDSSTPKPETRDLKKNFQELRQFIRENSIEPKSPVASPTKLERYDEFAVKKVTREMSVQTDIMIDIQDVYICKHCGKSSSDEPCSPLTKENLKKAKQATEKTKNGDAHSVKSLGESSAKSDKSTKSKTSVLSGASYMKGTTSSRLKTNEVGAPDKHRKDLTPEMMLYSSKEPTSLKGKVSQKAKVFENASKGKTKPGLSVFRGNSVERSRNVTPVENRKSKMTKSKSVDEVNILNGLRMTTTVLPGKPKEDIDVKPETVATLQTPPSPGLKPGHDQTEKSEVEIHSPRSPRSPTKTKPPLVSAKPVPLSPRHIEVSDGVKSVESKGQFTTIVDNPFIKNDTKRRNSFKGKDKEESVWEKADVRSRDSSLKRSRDSSLKRSNSTTDADKASRGSSSTLQRSNTSVGEKTSVGHLTWSDSGSSSSLSKSHGSKGSKSSLHGSHDNLNDVFHTPEKQRSSSVSSQCSQNSMLNLLTPIGTTRNPVSGAIETDIDAACGTIPKTQQPENELNEESVNKAHLEFAKQACALLEKEVKKRDSSNESDKGTGAVVNGAATNGTNGTNGTLAKPETTTPQSEAQPQTPSPGSKKGKKGLKSLFRR